MKLSDNGCAIFYDFWLTQYTLRKKSFVKDYEEARTAYEALQSAGIISDDNDKENFDTHQTGFAQQEIIKNFTQHSLPKSIASKHVVTLFDFAQKYNFFRLSCQTVKMDKVLTLISEGKDMHKKPGIFRMKLNEFETISSVKNEVFSRASNKESLHIMTISVDTSKEYELTIKEVSALYWERKYEASLLYKYMELVRNNSDKNDIECHEIASSDVENIYNKATDAYNEMWSFKTKSLKKASFSLDDTPRAIGLWQWDYIVENYGHSKPPRGKIAEARRELAKRFDLSKLGYADSDPKVIEDKYRGTCKCIEAREVLPF